MTAAGRVLRIGDEVRFDGQARTVTEISGTRVTLASPSGELMQVTLADLYQFGSLAGGRARPRLAPGAPAGLPESAMGKARWWEGHIIEVITGVAPDADPGAPPRPEYDPAATSVAQRDRAKAAELRALGHGDASERTVRRRRTRYQAAGLRGLADARYSRLRPDGGQADERVVATLRRLINDAAEEPTRTGTFYLWKTELELAAEHGPGIVPMPSRATFFRLLARLSHGRHTTGSARTRQSMASQPPRPYGTYTVVRPGQLMELDSTPLDVMVRLPNGVEGRVELSGIIDVATRTLSAGVLRPTTKSVDASLLLARTLTPEPMRPGWAAALHMSRSVLPYQPLLSIDERLAHAAARPVIAPETIVFDQAAAFISANFRGACRQLGVDLQPAHPGTPDDKPRAAYCTSSG